jgi:transposase InsO family protein
VQYASAAYRRLLAEAGFTPSMSRVGDCWDNSVMESFFATLTKELLIDGVCRAIVAHTAADDQAGIVLLPHLDSLV